MNLDIVPVKSERKQLVQEQIMLRFSLFDLEKERPAPDLGPLRYLLFGPLGKKQKQGWAEQLEENLYEVAFGTPARGCSYLFFACPKSGVWYAELPHLILQATDEEITVHRKAAEAMGADHQC